MSEIKFGPPSGLGSENPAPAIDVKSEVVQTPDPATTTVCPPAPAAVGLPAVPAATGLPAPTGLLLGDYIPEFKDVIFPRINLAQNIGGLKDSFAPGTLIFGHIQGEQFVLYEGAVVDNKTGNQVAPATPPATIICLGFRPVRFVEMVPGGARGMIVNTEDEVRKNGGTLDYEEWKLKARAGMKRFSPLADMVTAVQAPVNMTKEAIANSPFVYEINGTMWSLGLWSMKSTIYTAAAKQVFFTNRSLGYLRGGYPTRLFAVTTIEKPFNNGANKSWVPVCIPIGPTTPEMLAFARQVLNAPNAPVGE